MEIEETVPFLEELDELLNDRKFKRTLELFLYYKKKMIPEAISEFTSRGLATVYRTINNWQERGEIEDRSGRGRSPGYSTRVADKVVEKQLQNRRKSIKSIHREMAEEGSQISYFQTRSIINQTFTVIDARRKIVISPKNKQERLNWIESHEKWRKSKWESVRALIFFYVEEIRSYGQTRRFFVCILNITNTM